MKRRTFLGAIGAPLLVGMFAGESPMAAAAVPIGPKTGAPATGAPSFRVDSHRGSPALFVDDVPRFPMYLFEQEISVHDGQVFDAAGVEFYSFIEKDSYLDLGWTGPGQQDFSVIDRVLATFDARVAAGYTLPRLHLWAPSWWLDAHPAEVLGYAVDPSGAQLERDASFASATWLAEAGVRLRAMIRHILDGPQGERVMGVTLAGGLYGEWLYFNADYLPDTTESMRLAWVAHLRTKYGNDAGRLHAAWNDPTADFATVTIPTTAERRSTSIGLFRDPLSAQKVIDYYEAFHQAVVDAIDHFAWIVKDESGGSLLTSVLYGYTPDQGYLPQEQHHRAAAAFHRLGDVDLVTSPHSYYRRAPGDDGAYRTYTESVSLHGKLFVDESDDRTHLAAPGTSFVYATTMAESLGIVRRAFGQAVTHATGLWYMDQSSGLWYADPAFATEFASLKHWGDYSMNVSRKRTSEVAVISVTAGEFSLGGETDTTAKLFEGPTLSSRQGMGELSRAGAPFDRYLIEDLVDGSVPSGYKVYVFPDAFRLTAAERIAVDALKSGGRTLIWGWAPGYATDSGLSKAAVESLTGFSLSLTTASGGTPPDPNTPLRQESFESGGFGSAFSAGAVGTTGTITSQPAEVIAGAFSVKGTAPATKDWQEFLYSVPSAVPLEANATYRVTFRTKTLTAPGAGAYFYFVARTGSGGVPQDVGSNQWSDSVGASAQKSFEFTLKNFSDYYLIWGIHNGGGLSIDDVVITKTKNAGLPPVSYHLDPVLFPGVPEARGGEIQLDPLFVPTGTGFTTLARSTDAQSIPVIAAKQLTGWRSVLATTPPVPSAVLRRLYRDAGVWVYQDSDDNFEANASWVSVHAATAGTKTVAFPTPEPVYDTTAGRLLGTSVSTVSLTMAKGDTAILTRSNPFVHGGVTFDFETGSFARSHFTPGFNGTYGTITSAAGTVVAGAYSAHGAAPVTTDWYEFLYSNPAEIVLRASTTYTVRFTTKSVQTPGVGGHFYFLARSQAVGASSDAGFTTWTDPVGVVQSREVTFTTGTPSDYRLIWGLRNGGALSVDTITVVQHD
ncbi:hypothetical protein [Leifsonia poae]|uniref:hypothetical protein n=1 Tax=Leifsonia poae TaxID=110933 RepID=UPI001CBBC495|nr:hypothetical protein [Leifsonia poae]